MSKSRQVQEPHDDNERTLALVAADDLEPRPQFAASALVYFAREQLRPMKDRTQAVP